MERSRKRWRRSTRRFSRTAGSIKSGARPPTVSFQIPVQTQAEVDRLTDALSAVPEAEQCGWVKDRFGLSWQIVPRLLVDLLADEDPARAKRAFTSMMTMKRIDTAALERDAARTG